MTASTATLWDCGYIFVVAFGMVFANLSRGIILLILSKDTLVVCRGKCNIAI